MSTIWYILMLSSLVVMLFSSPSLVINTMIDESMNIVSLCINLLAIYSVWLGILEIVDKSGLGEKLANLLAPIIKKLFKIENKEQIKYISLNLSANLLGLGNAATPSGIKAIKSMDKDLPKTRFAMLLLLIINSTGIQLIPTTIIGLRISANSHNASDIILPTLFSSFFATFVCVLIFMLFNKFKKEKNG